MRYEQRVVDTTLDRLMTGIAAIALDGAKGVGKTATGSQRATTVLDLSSVKRREAVLANEDLVTSVPRPVLVDEWQLVPEVWDRIKREVDTDPTAGQFLLAGSATVPPGVRIHSGAGRILSLKMRPMSIAERGLDTSTVSLRDLLDGSRPTVEGVTDVGISQYTDEILASGFPGIRRLPAEFRDDQIGSYIDRLMDRELPDNGATVRKPVALRAWLSAYAAATSSPSSYTTILDAATAGHDVKAARPTFDTYREHLTRVFVLEPLPAWIPAFNPLKQLGSAPKHHLVDPALAAHLVGVGKHGLLAGDGVTASAQTGTWLGALFESLVVQSVRVYADAARAHTSHLRTRDARASREIDIVVEGRDRRVVAIEVKLAPTVSDKDVRHLNWLESAIGDRLADKLLINTGITAYRRPDGVAVVPLALLGP